MIQERIADIYLDGRHYDQLFADGDKDIAFWISQASKHGEAILELACGTGRITITDRRSLNGERGLKQIVL